MNLTKLYQTIAQNACETIAWPDSGSFCNLLTLKDGLFLPPTFPENGPVALVALVSPDSNPSAMSLVEECLSVRSPFLQEVL